MSEPSAQTQLLGAATLESRAQDYQLSDDLARLCLPQEYRDSYRRLAWVNSICLLFLIVGLVGLRPPKIIYRPLTENTVMPAEIVLPPQEQPKVEPQVKPDEPDQPQDTTDETPQVMTIVAPANATPLFAVPVTNAVLVAREVHQATPPPPVINKAPPTAQKFNPGVADGGNHPSPEYPGIALRNHYQGTVTIEFVVDPTGRVSSAKVQKSSGFPVLDEAALDIVKNRWSFPPDGERLYYWPCQFQLQ